MKKMFFLGVIFLLLFSFLVGVTSFSDLQKSLSAYSEEIQTFSDVCQGVFRTLKNVVSKFVVGNGFTKDELDSFRNPNTNEFDIDNYACIYYLKYYDCTYEIRTVKKYDFQKGDVFLFFLDEVVIYSTCPNISVGSSVKSGLLSKTFQWTENGKMIFKYWAPWNFSVKYNPVKGAGCVCDSSNSIPG